MDTLELNDGVFVPWNKGKLLGPKPPLKPKQIWSIRIHLQISGKLRDLAMFNLAIDSKLRGCDLVRLRLKDVATGGAIANRASVVQRKTGHPVQFEITAPSRTSLQEWVNSANLKPNDYIFRSRSEPHSHISTRQYARLVKTWVRSIGLDPKLYGTHSLRRTKAALIYKQSKNLRAVQLLLGHTKLESTVKYLGIEMDDALELAEKTEI